ncbi:MAG: DUF5016 domain-containing protein [Dysgonamonadaceae bacterium]|jgi:hypothetical protein|nr:DUF5016 domain-containing protein [Dysgonamonadaceae bacterium]
MKNIKWFILAISTLLIAACEEKDSRTHFPDSTPVIESATIRSTQAENPSVIVFGDSIVLNAVLSDAKTPLSTLRVEIIVNDNLVKRTEIRTPGNSCSISEKYRIPLVANAADNTDVEVYLKLTNVEGNTTEKALTAQVSAKRPASFGNSIYFVFQDGTVLKANKALGVANEYQSVKTNIEKNNISFKIAQKLTADNQIDYSGFVWGNVNGELAVCSESDPDFEYRDALIVAFKQLFFNVYSFEFSIDADRLKPLQIDGIQLGSENLDGVDFMTLTKAFTKNAEVTFSGFEDLTQALLPDFFEITAGDKAKFLGLSGSYKFLYNMATGFLYVEQPEAVYPDALWLDGSGMGFPSEPYAMTTSWNWNKPEDYIFCRKMADGEFQATFYTEKFDMKFFHQRMWGGEENSADYTLTPAGLLLPGEDNQGKPNGNWISGPDIVPGVYRVSINLNDKTTTVERIK